MPPKPNLSPTTHAQPMLYITKQAPHHPTTAFVFFSSSSLLSSSSPSFLILSYRFLLLLLLLLAFFSSSFSSSVSSSAPRYLLLKMFNLGRSPRGRAPAHRHDGCQQCSWSHPRFSHHAEAGDEAVILREVAQRPPEPATTHSILIVGGGWGGVGGVGKLG